jgi:hypothetical protein
MQGDQEKEGHDIGSENHLHVWGVISEGEEDPWLDCDWMMNGQVKLEQWKKIGWCWEFVQFLRLSKDQKSRFGLDVWWPSRSGGCKVEVVVVVALVWCWAWLMLWDGNCCERDGVEEGTRVYNWDECLRWTTLLFTKTPSGVSPWVNRYLRNKYLNPVPFLLQPCAKFLIHKTFTAVSVQSQSPNSAMILWPSVALQGCLFTRNKLHSKCTWDVFVKFLAFSA